MSSILATMIDLIAKLLVFLAALVLGCKSSSTATDTTTSESAKASGSPAPGRMNSSDTPPIAPTAEKTTAAQATALVILYSSEKKTWFEEQVQRFASSGAKLQSGQSIRIDARAMGSGEAMQALTAGEIKPHVFSPASGAYITLLNRAWLSQAGHTAPLSPPGDPLVLSPVVIAMWKPMAEALGWPKKNLGWKDLLRVNANPAGWGAHGHPEWGAFKLGHTHPEFSNSGLLSVLAEAYAGAKKARGLTPADVSSRPTSDFIASVEKTIVHYGKSTGFFADKMLERGPSYLSAAVLYENLVIESYSKTPPPTFPVVALYPTEGTFWSDHPYAVLDAPWVGPEEREAAQKFFAFLKERASQERALALGFRPADTAIAISSPVDVEHGVDPKQPQALLEVPDAATLDALLDSWRRNKKTADVVLVFDKSGSMDGKPLAEAKAGAKAFIEALGDRDQVSLLFFDEKVYPPVGPMPLGPNRHTLLERVDGAIAGGGTALYDATLAAYKQTMLRGRTDPASLHAVVVMTDGKDENSKIDVEALEKDLRVEGSTTAVKVFTIAYGAQAEARILARVANAAQGSSAQGNVDTIVQVYRDMASFF